MANPRQRTRKKSDFPSTDDGHLTLAREIASEKLLIFRIAGEIFGLRLAAVTEITRLPELARMPLVPRCLLGLANLRGTVLPVISLRFFCNCLNLKQTDKAEWSYCAATRPLALSSIGSNI